MTNKKQTQNDDGTTKPEWAIKQVKRGSGLIEDICEHGIGHPNEVSLKKMEKRGLKGFGIHGCDGCCSNHPSHDGNHSYMRCNTHSAEHLCSENRDALPSEAKHPTISKGYDEKLLPETAISEAKQKKTSQSRQRQNLSENKGDTMSSASLEDMKSAETGCSESKILPACRDQRRREND